jgi:hypothetical protein
MDVINLRVCWTFIDTTIVIEELASWATETIVVSGTIAVSTGNVAFVTGVSIDVRKQAGRHGTLGNALANIVLGEHVGLVRARRALVHIGSGTLTA